MCLDAQNCPYAHDLTELRATPMLFRTVICSWWKKGQCEFGDSCRFAHGEDQLRESTSMSSPSRRSESPLQTPSYVEAPGQYATIFAAALAAATSALEQSGVAILTPEQTMVVAAASSAAAHEAMNLNRLTEQPLQAPQAPPAEVVIREELNKLKKGFASSPALLSFFGEDWDSSHEARPRAESDNLMEELKRLWVDQPQGVPLMRSDPFLSASHMTLDSFQINND